MGWFIKDGFMEMKSYATYNQNHMARMDVNHVPLFRVDCMLFQTPLNSECITAGEKNKQPVGGAGERGSWQHSVAGAIAIRSY